ncbi:MAG: phosphoribosylformylglycinamidine synthase subunit PurS [Alphaproteobacteria bacterium]|nr:phosphoribosylformylglycinamidine synthase subunit PurS [Alphaproteobacteria bacterium]
MKAIVEITLKKSVLDPQGQAIAHALHSLNFQNVETIRQGKLIEIDLKETDKIKAKKSVEDMCKKLLVNEIIEIYEIKFVGE